MTSECLHDTGGDSDRPTTVTIAAQGIGATTRDPGVMTGKRHIVIDGGPLCNHPQVVIKVDHGKYVTEEVEYPLGQRNLCGTCASKYVAVYGSKDSLFRKFPTFEQGDWVELHTDSGIYQGRLRNDASDDVSRRHLTVVLSDEPRARWAYGVENEIRVQKQAGQTPKLRESLLDDTSDEILEATLQDITPIDTPERNIDQQTEAVRGEIGRIGEGDIKRVSAIGADRQHFVVNTVPNLAPQATWELTDRLYDAGYDIAAVQMAAEREHTDGHQLGLLAPGNKITPAGSDTMRS